MVRFGKKVVALFTAAAVGMSGCGLSKQPKMTYVEHDSDSAYDSTSLQLELPAVEREDPFEVPATAAPITIQGDDPPSYRVLSLEEVVRIALVNSPVLRD